MSQSKTQVAYYGPVYIKNNCLILPVKAKGDEEQTHVRTEITITTSDVGQNVKQEEVSSCKEISTQISSLDVPELNPLPEPLSESQQPISTPTPCTKHDRTTKQNGVAESPKKFFRNFKSYLRLGKAKSDPTVCEFGIDSVDKRTGEQVIAKEKELEEVDRVLEGLDDAIDLNKCSKGMGDTNGTSDNTNQSELHDGKRVVNNTPLNSTPLSSTCFAEQNDETIMQEISQAGGARPKVQVISATSSGKIVTQNSPEISNRKILPQSWLHKNVHSLVNSVRHVEGQQKYPTESRATFKKVQTRRSHERHRRFSSSDLDVPSNSKNKGSILALGGLLGRRSRYFAVVAIDFGTTFSGYAYSFTDDPTTIHMMRRLEGGDPGVFNQKTPTTILLTPEGHFHSFGYAARDYFHDLDPKEARKWMYLERFKMMLHGNASLSKDSTLTSNNGKQISSLKVFSYGVAFFRDHALKELSDQSGLRVTCDDIRWVITVPAIWNASAKQFMRQAAYDSGIVSPDSPDQLLIALEPEAASIYCRRLRMYELVADENEEENADDTPTLMMTSVMTRSPSQTELRGRESVVANDIAIGTRYLVVDCGGGTVDITVHQMEEEGKLKELYRATGGPHGSVGVDEEFERLLRSIFGSDCIDQFQQKRPSGWVDLMISFESKKRTASPARTTPIMISFPFAFIDFYKKYRGSSLESAVKKHGDKDLSWTPHGMFRMMPGAMRRLFLPTVDRIKQAIGDVLNSTDVTNLSYLFLVGGFAESSILQHEIRKDFGHLLRVIIPQGVGMTIVKGAVLFGMDPLVVNERRSRLTYGVGVLHRFSPDRHPEDKKVTKDGIDWCTDILDKFVTVDQSVAVGDVVVRSYTPVRRDQTSTVINIYSTDRPDAQYINDPGVFKCGALSLELVNQNIGPEATVSKIRREIKTSMRFGDTEIKVTAVDVKSGNTVHANIDFFNT